MAHLLLVDDDEDILSLLAAFFRKHSHTVSVATDGRDMFAAVEKEAVDLVILDVMLQHEDGFSLQPKARWDAARPMLRRVAPGYRAARAEVRRQ